MSRLNYERERLRRKLKRPKLASKANMSIAWLKQSKRGDGQ